MKSEIFMSIGGMKQSVRPLWRHRRTKISSCWSLLATIVMPNSIDCEDTLQPLFQISDNDLYDYKCAIWSVRKHCQ